MMSVKVQKFQTSTAAVVIPGLKHQKFLCMDRELSDLAKRRDNILLHWNLQVFRECLLTLVKIGSSEFTNLS